MIKKILNFKFMTQNSQKGMTYVELIVVLGIFFVMTSILLFDYNKFQAKVDIKVLANDIALKIVDAQKDSLSGKLPLRSYDFAAWKPSYGVYFNTYTMNDKKSFVYFADLDQSGDYYLPDSCPGALGGTAECLDKILITKGNFISKVESYAGATPTLIADPLSLAFKRPDPSAIFKSNGSLLTGFDYIRVTITSASSSVEANIKIYPSGRIQIN